MTLPLPIDERGYRRPFSPKSQYDDSSTQLISNWDTAPPNSRVRSLAGATGAPEATLNYYGYVQNYDDLNGVQYAWAQGVTDVEYQREFYFSGGGKALGAWVLQWAATGRSLAAAASASAARTVLGLADADLDARYAQLAGPTTDKAQALGTASRRFSDIRVAQANIGGNAETGAQLNINGMAGWSRILRFQTAGVARWAIIGDSTAEDGSGVGTDLTINRYNDAGTFLGTALVVKRSTGTLALLSPLQFASYTVSTLPSASAFNGCTIRVSNGAGGANLATSNGSVWQFAGGATVS